MKSARGDWGATAAQQPCVTFDAAGTTLSPVREEERQIERRGINMRLE